MVFRMIRVDTNIVLDGLEQMEDWERLMGASVEKLHTCPNTLPFNGSSLMVLALPCVDFSFVLTNNGWKGSDGKGTKLKMLLADADSCSKNSTEVFDFASGDFQLVSKHDMYVLRGYFEGNTYAHFDSVFMYQARKLGFKIRGFFFRESDPDVIYKVWHQFHGSGGLEKRYSEFEKVITPLNSFRQNPLCANNSDDWGMRDYSFPEVVWVNGVLQK